MTPVQPHGHLELLTQRAKHVRSTGEMSSYGYPINGDQSLVVCQR